jgi:hypothetical protein
VKRSFFILLIFSFIGFFLFLSISFFRLAYLYGDFDILPAPQVKFGYLLQVKDLWTGLFEFQGLIIGNCEGATLIKQRASPPNNGRDTLYTQNIILSHRDIHSARAFWALLDIKGNSGAFIKGFESGCIDC